MVATPYSYRQYTGNGTSRDFAVPFPFLVRDHVGVYLGLDFATGTYTSKLVDGTDYTWTNDTSIRTTTAVASGVVLSVARLTPVDSLAVQWQDGSALVAEDLLTSDNQNLYVVQENTDLGVANGLLSQAATTTANTALTNSTAAQAAAAAAQTTANTATTSANAAVATANTANTNASAAVSTANTASSTAGSAAATANTASSNANTAISTANSATTTANNALTFATAANTKSDTAIAAVAAAVVFTPVTNVAAIPATPTNNTYISVTDATGLQSFTPLSGIPSGFVGDAGLTARLVYKTASTSWVWVDYYANNADSRYLKLSGGGMTGPLLLNGAPTASLHPATKAYVDSADATLTTAAAAAQSTANTAVTNAAAAQTSANTGIANAAAAQATANTAVINAATAQATANAALPKAGGTMTGAIVFAGAQATATTAAPGIVQLTDSTSSTSLTTAATPNSVKAAADLASAAGTVASAALPKAGGTMTGNISFASTQPLGSLQFTQTGTGAVARTADSKLKDVVSVKDFGAKGDSSTDDTAAIQAAIDAAEVAYRGVVFFPRGFYRVTASLKLPSFVTLRGESQEDCWITNQYAPLSLPHVVNKDPGSLIFAGIENLSFLFGQYGVKIDVTSEVAGLKLRNVNFNTHTEASFYCNKLLQTSTFENCNFENSKRGVHVPAYTSNANNFRHCGFLLNTEACVEMYISEQNTFYGCRFEGGGALSKPTIKVHQPKALSFDGCYFEATNQILLQETGSFNSVVFDNCHFTGAVSGTPSWTQYTINSDGIVNFGNNRWGEVPCDGAAKMQILGINNSVADPTKMLGSKDSITYLTATRSAYNIVSPVVACPNLTRSLITVDKLSTNGALTNLTMLSGILTTNLWALEAGGFDSVHAGIYRITFRTVGAANIIAHVTTINSTTLGGGVTATITTTTGSTTTASVSITFAGVTPATQISSAFQWSFECLNTSTTRSDIMIPRIT